MSENVLITASVASMIGQFNMNNIKILKDLGYNVIVATNFEHGSTMSPEAIAELKTQLDEMGVLSIQVDFPRGLGTVKKNNLASKQVAEILQKYPIKFIHTHAPLASMIVRYQAHKAHVPVIYTAHGFQFYKGSSLKNWAISYPIEKFFSRWTNILITINNEDFAFAQKHFKHPKIMYIPGIGIDIDGIRQAPRDETFRGRLDVPEDAVLLMSVGELNERKNHIEVIRAVNQLQENSNIYYVICGIGNQKYNLLEEAEKGIGQSHLKFPGYVDQVASKIKSADIFVFPSKREGLPVSLLEAAATGIPLIASKIRGNTDIISRRSNTREFDTANELIKAITEVIDNIKLKKEYPVKFDKTFFEFDNKNISSQIRQIYSEM